MGTFTDLSTVEVAVLWLAANSDDEVQNETTVIASTPSSVLFSYLRTL